MPDFNVRSDAVNVEQIMEQIRARILEKRGVDYTEAQIHELASVKLEKFLDPRGVRSDLLEQFRRTQPPYAPPELPNYAFEADTLFTSTRGSLRWIRKLLLPILKLFFNPNPLIQALNIQSSLNAGVAEREAKRDAARHAFDQLHYEVMHNLVIETTRLGIEMTNLKMRLESLSSRLEFNERRARALESVVAYQPAAEERVAKPDAGGREDARRDDSRRDDRRRDDSRRDDSRRDDRRREDPKRDDSRKDDTRRQEPRRPDPPARQPPPAPADGTTAAPAAEPAAESTSIVEVTAAAESGEPAPPLPAGVEGPGQKSRRRRRRRGRRGSGSATSIMGGEQPRADASADPSAGADQAGHDEGGGDADDAAVQTDVDRAPDPQAPEAHVDSRTGRPEPFEHAFGAEAHPAEPATSDPSHTTTPSPSAGQGEPPTAPESTSADPSATDKP